MLWLPNFFIFFTMEFLQRNYRRKCTGPRSAVGNVSGYRCVSDCNSRGHEFDPGPVPYFRGDWSWNNFYGHSPPFRWFIQEGLLSATSEGMCSSIPARSHTFVEIDHEIISTVILLPSADLFKKGCCHLQAKVCAVRSRPGPILSWRLIMK